MDENKETKEKMENKSKLSYVILGIIGLLVIIVLALGGYAIYRNIKINSNPIIKSEKSQNKKESNSTNINTNNSNNSFPYNSFEKGMVRQPAYKPIIYIYPTEETEVEVTLGNPQYLSCTYPKYENSWKVMAKPNGELIDTKTGRSLYALYWEGENIPKNINMQEGFCIKGEDTAKFLEEKLATLGLNEREAEEFIVYWLPQMEDNQYNYIRFETMEEQNEAMPLQVKPKPDNLIRIMMDWKSLDEPIEVQEQTLQIPSRDGYTVVEWGGSKIK